MRKTLLLNYCSIGLSVFLHIIILISIFVNLHTEQNKYRIDGDQNRLINVTIDQTDVNQASMKEKPDGVIIEKTQEEDPRQQVKAKPDRVIIEKTYEEDRRQQVKAKPDSVIIEKTHEENYRQQILNLKKQLRAQKKLAAARNQQLYLKYRARQKAKELKRKQNELQKKIFEQNVAAEQTRVEKARQAVRMQGIIDQYKAKIIGAIEQQWIIPTQSDKNLFCVLQIRLAPDGEVLSVETLKSSGSVILDRSARVAIFKASPLPVPKDSTLFSKFRELHLTVRPLQIE